MRIRVTQSSQILVGICVMIAFGACDSGAYPRYDRVQLLRETTEMLVLPALADATARGHTLRTTTASLCASPNVTTLAAARSAWRDSFVSYHATVAYQVGPARTSHLTSLANWPPDLSLVEDIASGAPPYASPIDASFVDALPTPTAGYSALEYLLYAYPDYVDHDDTLTLAALADARRCTLAAMLADRIARLTEDVNAAWLPSGQDYADVFVNATDPTVFTSPQAAVAALVSQVDEALDKIRDDRLGTPLGRTTHHAPVQSPYAGASVDAMQACFGSALAVWSGTPHGLDAFLRTRNARLADGMIAQFDATRDAIAALQSPPLAEPWETYATAPVDHTAGNTAYDGLVVLQQALTSDVGSTMGLSVGLPADGD
jgi:predicted lipoprotein